MYGSEVNDQTEKQINITWWTRFYEPILVINHYALMSEEHWFNIRAKKGDINCWHDDNMRKNREYFDMWDINQYDDFRLYEQNKSLFSTY